MPKIDLTAASKKEYTHTFEEGTSTWPGAESMIVACLQRIAKASETMARTKSELEAENQSLKHRVNILIDELDEMFLIATRQETHIKRLKTKLKNAQRAIRNGK